MPFSLERLARKRAGMVASWLFFIALALALAACDDPATTGPPAHAADPRPCVPGELTLDDGTCQPAGLPPNMPCPPGEMRLDNGTCQPAGLPSDMPCPPGEMQLDDGTCQEAGVPASACGAGFLPDGKAGCEPVLPVDPCPEGMMAIPGDAACHEVAPCGSGTWGDIPVEANTQFVDKAYAGGSSNGTKAKPWTTIQKGVNAAADGAIVAVAAGSYSEDVLIQGKPVRLWGRCPAMVEVAGAGVDNAAVRVRGKAASGAEVHGVAVSGAKAGIYVSGALDIVIEGAWIHGAGSAGFVAQDSLGPTRVVMKDSLIEQAHDFGVFVEGSQVTIEATAVRSTQPDAQGFFGRGINVRDYLMKTRADVTVRGCLVEQSREFGVFVGSSDAVIEATVVRSTLPDALGQSGRGIGMQDDPGSKARANVTIRACLVEQSREIGVFVGGSDARIEATVIRSTLPDELGEASGIGIQDDPVTKERASATVHACLIEENHGFGVFVEGSDATIEGTVVRSTLPDGMGDLGNGIAVQNKQKARSKVTVRGSLVEQNHKAGVFVGGSDAWIESTVVRSTLPNNKGRYGRGINIEDDPGAMERANVTIDACLVEQNHEAGILVTGSDATIEATVVRSTLPDGLGKGGLGIGVQGNPTSHALANVSIGACLIEKNEDAGVSVDLSSADVRACVIEQNRALGIFISGGTGTIEGTVVRSTLPDETEALGRGINIQNDLDTGARASVAVRACLVEQSHEIGVFVSGSDATIEASVIRSALPDVPGGGGRGISIGYEPDTKDRASVAVLACLVEQNREVGVIVLSSDATIEGSVIRSTLPSAEGLFGRGINVDSDLLATPATTERANVAVRACLVEQNQEIGVAVLASDATIEATAVRDTAPNSDGKFGDGVTVDNGKATIQGGEISGNARAGVASFRGEVLITDAVIHCNGVDLEGEPVNGVPFSFDGSTGWQCSGLPPAECTELGSCHVETTGIEAPAELPPVDPLPEQDPL